MSKSSDIFGYLDTFKESPVGDSFDFTSSKIHLFLQTLPVPDLTRVLMSLSFTKQETLLFYELFHEACDRYLAQFRDDDEVDFVDFTIFYLTEFRKIVKKIFNARELF